MRDQKHAPVGQVLFWNAHGSGGALVGVASNKIKVTEHDKQTKYILCTQYNSYRAHEQSQINVTLPASASAGVAFQIQPGLTSRDAGVLQHVEIV